MDTRFWGPPAWRFLHTLTFKPGDATATRRVFELLPYILPCKFCRHSLTDIYESLPIPRNLRDFPNWFYKVHTAVNDKLRRNNGQQIPKEPSFAEVKELYESRLPAAAAFPAWDFLFAVAYTHPLSTPEAPIPDHPNCTHKCEAEKNRWNTLTPVARLKYWRAFWQVLPAAMANPWRTSWETALEKTAPAFKNRRTSVAWLWRMRCAFEGSTADPYKEVCDILAYHASDCGGKRRAITCRRFRESVAKRQQGRQERHKRTVRQKRKLING